MTMNICFFDQLCCGGSTWLEPLFPNESNYQCVEE